MSSLDPSPPSTDVALGTEDVATAVSVPSVEKLAADTSSFTFPPITDDLNSLPLEPNLVGFSKSSLPSQEGLQVNGENDASYQGNKADDAFDDMIVVKDGTIASASPLNAAATDGTVESGGLVPTDLTLDDNAHAPAGDNPLADAPENKTEQPVIPVVAEQSHDEKPSGEGHVVTETDVQEIKGQKVLKRFGRKQYTGEVIGYDPESKWFKVHYEDGDEEDLELWEVKPILASAVQASSSKKRLQNDEEELKSVKRQKKSSAEGSSRKKSPAKPPKTPKSKSKKSPAKALTSPKTKGKSSKKPTKGNKAAKSPGTPQMQGSKSRTKTKRTKEAKPASTKRVLDLSSPNVSIDSSKKRWSTPKTSRITKTPRAATPHEMPKTKKTPKSVGKRKAEKDAGAASKTKSLKKQMTAGGPSCVGRSVKKNFDGTLYDGLVMAFDEKTQYYKVKYSDGDEEELEWRELEPILVPQESVLGARVNTVLIFKERVEA